MALSCAVLWQSGAPLEAQTATPITKRWGVALGGATHRYQTTPKPHNWVALVLAGSAAAQWGSRVTVRGEVGVALDPFFSGGFLCMEAPCDLPILFPQLWSATASGLFRPLPTRARKWYVLAGASVVHGAARPERRVRDVGMPHVGIGLNRSATRTLEWRLTERRDWEGYRFREWSLRYSWSWD